MKKGGVTPILLILLSIGIVVGVVLYIFDPFTSYAEKQDLQRKQDLEEVKTALAFYYRDYGRYPDYTDEFTLEVKQEPVKWGKEFKPYMDLLPQDPAFYKKYAYWADRGNNLQSFRLYAALDRPDLDASSCGAPGCKNVPKQNMCGFYMSCNFGLTSGNISP